MSLRRTRCGGTRNAAVEHSETEGGKEDGHAILDLKLAGEPDDSENVHVRFVGGQLEKCRKGTRWLPILLPVRRSFSICAPP